MPVTTYVINKQVDNKVLVKHQNLPFATLGERVSRSNRQPDQRLPLCPRDLST